MVAVSTLLPLLTASVRRVALKCGAAGGSVWVPTPWNSAAPAILAHVGDADPLPELATLEGAAAFAAAAAEKAPASRQRADGPGTVPSAAHGGWLIPIPLLSELWTRQAGPAPPAQAVRRLSDRASAPPLIAWLGLRWERGSHARLHDTDWPAVLDIAGALASAFVCSDAVLADPVTGLPGRTELVAAVRAGLERAASHRLPFSLLFLKLEGLDDVNAKHGRHAGDTVVRDFLQVVYRLVRSSDAVMRYGGATFALPLPDVSADDAVLVGEKLRRVLEQHRYLEHELQLACAGGVASWQSEDGPAVQPVTFMGRAAQALSAAHADRCRTTVLWRPDGSLAAAERLDPLLGVFTGHSDKDYRNMRLLWDVLEALSAATGATLAQAVVGRMFSLFSALRVALFQPSAGGQLQLVAGLNRIDHASAGTPLVASDHQSEEQRLVEEAYAKREPIGMSLEVPALRGSNGPLVGYGVPLILDGRAMGTLYMLGRPELLKADESDFPVLSSVAAQVALALDRERLVAAQRQRERQQQQRLKAELDSLRTVLGHTHFLHRSSVMKDLLGRTRRVASSEVTVLITGESGTGKEMLARTLHELSPRRHGPLAIVDCSAIPVSLMDSELFGRERGAYTGAERRSAGRLVQAEGGTVFLDEVGELPLEVQAKLLRFVQEKTLTMVGATREQRVDVRIIAATNRSLEDEVRAGRFREDLFHRLNVIRLRIPPLRERADDVLFLARHFLDRFAQEHAKPIAGFDAAAEERLLAYPWPGNVRELQNLVLQAVVLTESELVTADDLQLPVVASDRGTAVAPPRLVPRAASSSPEVEHPSGATPNFHRAWEALRERLVTDVAAVTATSPVALPLARWLAHELVLLAREQSAGVLARAATLVGLPESTYARQLRQAQADVASSRRPESWGAVRLRLDDLLRAPDRPSGNLPDMVSTLLLRVVNEARLSTVQAASLMDLSTPTLKRRLAQLDAEPAALHVCA